MITKIEWTARVSAKAEEVDNLLEFAAEVERGLKASSLVPDDAEVVKLDSFMGSSTVVVQWHTENEMENAPNYKTA